MNAPATLPELVRQIVRSGWTLIRDRKHRVFKSPDGFTLVVPGTQSDNRRGTRNTVAILRRFKNQGCQHIPDTLG